MRSTKPGRWRQRWNRAVCAVTGHPVDIATGRMFTEVTDFVLPGPLPLRFDRVYDSSLSWRDSPLGHGWSHSLDEAVWLERGRVVVRRDDGREVEVPTMHLPGCVMRAGDSIDDPLEGFELRCTAPGRFELETRDGVIHEYMPIIDEHGAVVSRLIARRRRDGACIQLSYDKCGRLASACDSGGRLVKFEHDAQGRLASVRLPKSEQGSGNSHRAFQYDAQGNLVAAVDSMGNAWRYAYVGHLMVQETDRAGLSFYFQYDGLGAGAKCVRTWGDGGIYDHVITYDAANRRTLVENSLGAVTIFEMDEAGQLVSSYEMQRDPIGRMQQETGFDGFTQIREHDAAGRVVRTRLPSGRTTECAYDAVGRLLEVKHSDGTATRCEYRLDGAIMRAQNESAEVVFERDALGRRMRCRR